MDLYGVDMSCYPDVVDSIFSSSKFAFWEVNARNIIAEIYGVIVNQKEYALRDAIGIAYSPYNRQAYNTLPPAPMGNGSTQKEREIPFVQRTEKYAGGSLDLKTLLLEDSQHAITSASTALNPNNSKVYEFALIVSYGVDRRYFYDTSYGAVDYRHRHEGSNPYLDCGTDGPAFFFLVPTGVLGGDSYRYGLTSAELEARYSAALGEGRGQDGRLSAWPDWDFPYPWPSSDSWLTPYPPNGCNYLGG